MMPDTILRRSTLGRQIRLRRSASRVSRPVRLRLVCDWDPEWALPESERILVVEVCGAAFIQLGASFCRAQIFWVL